MKIALPAVIALFLLACHNGSTNGSINTDSTRDRSTNTGSNPEVLHTASGIEATMAHYDSLIKKMDADSIAWIYAPDGQLGTTVRGRDSIRRFLSTFKNVRVMQVGSATTNITITGDSASHTGTYTQDALINGKDTVHVKGSYQAEWIWMDKEGWKIRRMITRPE